MERYAEYRDSGVEWIGEIPAGWRADLRELEARISGELARVVR